MQRTITACSLVLMVAGVVCAEEPLANQGRKGLQAKSIDEVLALPDDQIDIGMAALLIGREYDLTVDVATYLAQLDRMARELRARLGPEREPAKIIALMNEYVFEELGCVPVTEAEAETEHGFLHTLLVEKQGTSSALPSLYVALAERVGLPIVGVRSLDRTFVRWSSAEVRLSVDVSARGAVVPDAALTAELPVPGTAQAQAFYMQDLKPRGVRCRHASPAWLGAKAERRGRPRCQDLPEGCGDHP